jgi:hypothetical protein
MMRMVMSKTKKTIWVMIAAVVVIIGGFFVWQAMMSVPTKGDWQKPFAVQSTAEIHGNLAIVHNVRNFRYNGSEDDADITAAYYDKTYDLDQLKRVWYIVEPFKNFNLAAHTFLSFEFSNGEFLSISIEARKLKGQEYNVFWGLFHTYPLIYIAEDERDSIYVRANIRQADVYAYPVKLSKPEHGKEILADMLNTMNDLVVHPTWYNTLWPNCTSAIATHINRISPHRLPVIPWQLWVTGYADELAFRSGLIDTNLSLDQARKKFYVSEKSRQIGNVDNYSALIRE